MTIKRARAIEDAIRQVLLHHWDPIGVADAPEAANEYDSYIGALYRLLASGADEATIATHLADIQTDAMGLTTKPESVMEVARRLRGINVTLQD